MPAAFLPRRIAPWTLSRFIGKTIYSSRAEAERAIFEYIEVFYNRIRTHSTLDYLSPEEFEEESRSQVK